MAKDGPAHTDIRTPHDGISRNGNHLTGVVEFRGGMYEKIAIFDQLLALS